MLLRRGIAALQITGIAGADSGGGRFQKEEGGGDGRERGSVVGIGEDERNLPQLGSVRSGLK